MPENESLSRPKRRKRSPAARFFLSVGRFFAAILTTVLIVAVFLFAVCGVLTHGPSEHAKELFVNSLNETSALKFLPYWFLPAEEVQRILTPAQSEQAQDTFRELRTEPREGQSADEPEEQQPLVQIDENSISDELELIDIKKPTFKGKLLIVHDPSRVIVGTLDKWGDDPGLLLTDYVKKYNAVAGTNAGSFEDDGGGGNGGRPDGLVMKDGRIDYGYPDVYYIGVIGFDADHVLHVGDMSGQGALNLGLVTAVSFSYGGVLIKDGVKRTNLGGGINPRTCIGQRSDGAVLLLVVEGRHPDSIGATYDDLADLMEEYGAVNAGNLDGGSSSAMIFNGEQITKGSNLIGARELATAILVLPEGVSN